MYTSVSTYFRYVSSEPKDLFAGRSFGCDIHEQPWAPPKGCVQRH